ncbi:hypothetical protein AURANDRAFT_64401 [Aureococcus anophagefferens]|uniref:Uncharacterized protein n=1 Tax=Aureococcus anophagefferens TaxID=44056 RepID=F0YA12_AURAN|nr:hypothetical protein AURANDRAFT_64401 [Aureococcus anophagefferens]EGB08082.1 hypothetical protein AURANDRAFT_64401 [Aureococcus anophagefferens]|eukprot:XP_009037440.1 hypothetical protein AURANDRAFT_64401 [Aureococcus anophagefferens]
MHSAESISGGPSGLLGRRAQRMHKGRHIFCRAASMARISGRERASLVRRVGAAVERHAPKIMKMSMLVGAMACLAGTRSSSCMPRPVDLDETLEPTFTDGARKYWHLRFTCPCSEKTPAAARGPVVSSDRIDEGVGSSDSSDEGCAGCAKCVTKDALLREADMEIQSLRAKLSTPGAAWAKTVEALPNRTQGMAKKGLALMARLEPTSTPRANGGPDGSGSDDDSSDDPEPPRPRRRVTAARVDEPSAGPATEAKARDVNPVLAALFVHGGGDQSRTAAILQAVVARAGKLLRLDLKEIKALRAMGRAIKGYFSLAALPNGGTRRKYAQQKVDAVMEAVTPADGAAKNLLRGISRVCCGDNVSHSVIGRFSNAADRRKLQDDAGKLARHRMRALRSDLVDLACAREYWHQNDDVRLDTFAGRCTKKVKIVTVQVDSDGRRTLVVKEEHHQRHTKHAGDLEIYQAFLKSAGYASHLAAHPSHKISFTLFKRAKCPCIGEPHQRECADEIKTSMRERLLALNRLRLSDTDVEVKLREYRLQPRTVKGEDDEGNSISSTMAVKELTEVMVTGSKEDRRWINANARRDVISVPQPYDLFTAVRDGRPKPSMDWNASPTILAKKSTLSLDKYFYRFITWTQDDPIGVDDDDPCSCSKCRVKDYDNCRYKAWTAAPEMRQSDGWTRTTIILKPPSGDDRSSARVIAQGLAEKDARLAALAPKIRKGDVVALGISQSERDAQGVDFYLAKVVVPPARADNQRRVNGSGRDGWNIKKGEFCLTVRWFDLKPCGYYEDYGSQDEQLLEMVIAVGDGAALVLEPAPRKGRARGAPAQFQLAKASEAAIHNENLDKYVDRAAAGSSA